MCGDRVALVLTENVPDSVPLATQGFGWPVERIANERAKGFGANHNAAFNRCRTPYFCVANPDIRLVSDPFPALLESLQRPRAAVAGPLVRSPDGQVEDSARRFPTAASLLKKLFVEHRRPDYPADRGALEVDWIAGMFLLFRAGAYRSVGGFDERYFLYYEDVDICYRLRRAGSKALWQPAASVVHDARRASRRKLGLLRHHVHGATRFLLRSSAGRPSAPSG